MLATQTNQIRWIGIDMRARWRRCLAVIATYLAFFTATLWMTQWHGDGWLTPVKALFGLLVAMELITVFRQGGLVKSFDVPPSSLLERPGGKIALRWGRFLLRSSSEFKRMPPEKQQEKMRSFDQSFPYVVAEDDSPNAPDERERAQRDLASSRTLQFLSVILASGAVNAGIQSKSWMPVDQVALLLSYLVIARTGPKARILWSEPDPRDTAGEIQLVEKDA
jgi:hypothetical protein